MIDLGQYDAYKTEATYNGDNEAVFARFKARLAALENDETFLNELEKKHIKLSEQGVAQ